MWIVRLLFFSEDSPESPKDSPKLGVVGKTTISAFYTALADGPI